MCCIFVLIYDWKTRRSCCARTKSSSDRSDWRVAKMLSEDNHNKCQDATNYAALLLYNRVDQKKKRRFVLLQYTYRNLVLTCLRHVTYTCHSTISIQETGTINPAMGFLWRLLIGAATNNA